MPDGFSFSVTHSDPDTHARLGIIRTPHGAIETPEFVPVGTRGSIKSLDGADAEKLGVRMFFVNTYHMYLRPGIDTVRKAGGLHGFMNWDGPLITDSGGFQVFSLGRNSYAPKEDSGFWSPLSVITEDGVSFRSHWDGSQHTFTPESSMRHQWDLGADIHVAFDDCTPYPVSEKTARISMERTHRWAERSIGEHMRLRKSFRSHPQALYGVIQGSVYEDLRRESARVISSLPFDGIAIGGVSVGESKHEMARVLVWTNPILPPEKPRHLLGVGEIDDIIRLVSFGMDTFDCVQPTRLARMGHILTTDPCIGLKNRWRIDMTKTEYKNDMNPPVASCRCYTCRRFSRAYLHHLFRVRELLAYRLATIHNMYTVLHFTRTIRHSIRRGTFLDLKARMGVE